MVQSPSLNQEPRVLILGSGTPDGGWSGPRMLVDAVKSGVLKATIAGLVTHYPNGGVATLGRENEDLFPTHVIEGFPTRKKGEKFTGSQLSEIRDIYAIMIDTFWGIDSIEYVLLSGWMKLVLWLPVEKDVNIHPGRMDKGFGGDGMHGDNVHRHAIRAYHMGDIIETAVTMHFVDEELDHGPIIAQQPISLEWCISWEDAKSRVVGATEHRFQLAVTKALLEGKVALRNGKVVWDPNFAFEDPSYYKGSLAWD